MNVYKLRLEDQTGGRGEGIVIRGAATPEDARHGFPNATECELLPGVTLDPDVKLPPQVYEGKSNTPMPGVISYDWFED